MRALICWTLADCVDGICWWIHALLAARFAAAVWRERGLPGDLEMIVENFPEKRGFVNSLIDAGNEGRPRFEYSSWWFCGGISSVGDHSSSGLAFRWSFSGFCPWIHIRSMRDLTSPAPVPNKLKQAENAATNCINPFDVVRPPFMQVRPASVPF